MVARLHRLCLRLCKIEKNSNLLTSQSLRCVEVPSVMATVAFVQIRFNCFNMCYSIILLLLECLTLSSIARYQFYKNECESWSTIFQRLDLHIQVWFWSWSFVVGLNYYWNCSLPDMHIVINCLSKAPNPLELRLEQGILSLMILFYSFNMKI